MKTRKDRIEKLQSDYQKRLRDEANNLFAKLTVKREKKLKQKRSK